jgi:hypothetical protein
MTYHDLGSGSPTLPTHNPLSAGHPTPPPPPQHARHRVTQGQTNCTSFYQHITPSPWQRRISHCCVTALYSGGITFEPRRTQTQRSHVSCLYLHETPGYLHCGVLRYGMLQSSGRVRTFRRNIPLLSLGIFTELWTHLEEGAYRCVGIQSYFDQLKKWS